MHRTWCRDTNSTRDVFVYDRDRKTMQRVSVAADGRKVIPSGLAVAERGRPVRRFVSYAKLVPTTRTRLGRIYLRPAKRDFGTRPVKRVSVAANGTQGDGSSDSPSLSADGRSSRSVLKRRTWCRSARRHEPDFKYPCLRPAERDDRTGQRGSGRQQGNSFSNSPALSADGRFVGSVQRRPTWCRRHERVTDVFVARIEGPWMLGLAASSSLQARFFPTRTSA